MSCESIDPHEREMTVVMMIINQRVTFLMVRPRDVISQSAVGSFSRNDVIFIHWCWKDGCVKILMIFHSKTKTGMTSYELTLATWLAETRMILTRMNDKWFASWRQSTKSDTRHYGTARCGFIISRVKSGRNEVIITHWYWIDVCTMACGNDDLPNGYFSASDRFIISRSLSIEGCNI